VFAADGFDKQSRMWTRIEVTPRLWEKRSHERRTKRVVVYATLRSDLIDQIII